MNHLTQDQIDALQELRNALRRATKVGLLDIVNNHCGCGVINDFCDAVDYVKPVQLSTQHT